MGIWHSFKESFRRSKEHFRAFELIQQGLFQEAAEEAARQAVVNPADPFPRFFQGLALSAQARYNDAVDAFRAALEIQPEFHEARLALAEVFQEKHVSYQAIEELKKLLEMAPEHIPARYQLANIYLLSGFPQQALPHFEAVVAKEKKLLQAKSGLVLCYHAVGERAKAMAIYQQIKGEDHPLVKSLAETLGLE